MRSVFGKQRPTLRFERLPLTEAIMDVARAGMGIAVVSAWIAEQYLQTGELVAKRLASGALLRPWRLAYRSEFAHLAPRLLSALSSTLPRSQLAV
jgi:LysR family transcriptional regulator for metE and metH